MFSPVQVVKKRLAPYGWYSSSSTSYEVGKPFPAVGIPEQGSKDSRGADTGRWGPGGTAGFLLREGSGDAEHGSSSSCSMHLKVVQHHPLLNHSPPLTSQQL